MCLRCRRAMSSDQDDRSLARLGYKQQLKRTNGYLASLATSYQCTNPFVGVFTLYGQSLSLGPASSGGLEWCVLANLW